MELVRECGIKATQPRCSVEQATPLRTPPPPPPLPPPPLVSPSLSQLFISEAEALWELAAMRLAAMTAWRYQGAANPM